LDLNPEELKTLDLSGLHEKMMENGKASQAESSEKDCELMRCMIVWK